MTHATKPYRRGRQVVYPFTPDEDALVETMRIDGAGTTAIARAVFTKTGRYRSPATINMRLKTLARLAEDGN